LISFPADFDPEGFLNLGSRCGSVLVDETAE
jgi:hypothetical protein